MLAGLSFDDWFGREVLAAAGSWDTISVRGTTFPWKEIAWLFTGNRVSIQSSLPDLPVRSPGTPRPQPHRATHRPKHRESKISSPDFPN
jgi:hypothetical protein